MLPQQPAAVLYTRAVGQPSSAMHNTGMLGSLAAVVWDISVVSVFVTSQVVLGVGDMWALEAVFVVACAAGVGIVFRAF